MTRPSPACPQIGRPSARAVLACAARGLGDRPAIRRRTRRAATCSAEQRRRRGCRAGRASAGMPASSIAARFMSWTRLSAPTSITPCGTFSSAAASAASAASARSRAAAMRGARCGAASVTSVKVRTWLPSAAWAVRISSTVPSGRVRSVMTGGGPGTAQAVDMGVRRRAAAELAGLLLPGDDGVDRPPGHGEARAAGRAARSPAGSPPPARRAGSIIMMPWPTCATTASSCARDRRSRRRTCATLRQTASDQQGQEAADGQQLGRSSPRVARAASASVPIVTTSG